MREIRIGRSSGNDCVINSPVVSSMHAVVKFYDDGRVSIRDLNSKNGTFVNGIRIHSSETFIHHGDGVVLGSCPLDWARLSGQGHHHHHPRPVVPPVGGNAQRVEMFLMQNAKNFAPERIPFIREQLLAMPENNWNVLNVTSFNNPTTILILSIFLGYLGVDRFMIGDIALGVGKLLTWGGFGVWQIIDWFLIMGATREKNFEKLNRAISGRMY